MKIKVYNYDKIKESDITDKIIRVKALMINSNNEILLCEDYDTIQYPGGHLEDDELLEDALIREIKEETGIILKGNFAPFFAIKYYMKDYPVMGNNRSLEIYYFCIFTDEKYNLDNINLDDQERKGNFKRFYVSLKEFDKFLDKNMRKNEFNRVVNREMKLAMKNLKKLGKR